MFICTSYNCVKNNKCVYASEKINTFPIKNYTKPGKYYKIKTHINRAIEICKNDIDIECKIAWDIVEDLARSEATKYDNLMQLTKWRLYNQNDIDPHYNDITSFDL